MLQAPSPRKVTVIPASRPRCSRMVSRSASSWQGWKSSVRRVDHRHGGAARPSPRGRPGRRCARRSRRPAARAPGRCRLAVSLPPSWLLAVLMISGTPPRSAMPTANETRVRVDDLSKMTATVCGPASGVTREPVLLQLDGEVEDRGLLGLGEVVVAQEVTGHATASRASAKQVDELVDFGVADDERRCQADAGRVRGVDDQPAPHRLRGDLLGDRLRQADARAAARGRGLRRRAASPGPGSGAQLFPAEPSRWRAGPSPRSPAARRCAAAVASGLPPKVLPCCAGAEQLGRRARR